MTGLDDLEQLEAELLRCQEFLNSRGSGPAAPPPAADHAIPDIGPTNHALPGSRAATLNDLWDLLESAPAGPVELDPHLLYSPRSSVDDKYSDAGGDPAHPRPYQHPFIDSLQHQTAAPPPVAPGSEHPSKKRAEERLRELRSEAQRREMQECTFAPRTGRAPTGPRALPGHLPVEDRLLLTAGQRREEAVRRVRQEREEAEADECTFAPQLAAAGRGKAAAPPRRPLHERLTDEWRRKEAVMEAAAAKATEGASFKPQINPVSERLAARRRARQEDGSDGAARSHSAAATTEPSFRPEINPVSERILELSASVPADFERRQRHYERRRAEHRRALEAAEATQGAGRECTFIPATTGTATALLALSDERFIQAVETGSSRWERLAVEEPLSREARLRATAARVEAEEAPFEPQINARSRQLAAARRPEEEAARRAAAAEARRVQAAAWELRECTFAPNVAKPRVVGYYNEYQAPVPCAPLSIAAAAAEGPDALFRRINEYQMAREATAAAARRERENIELSACTFAPNTAASAASRGVAAAAPGAAAIPGMGRFLEVKALAERRAAEAEARAAQVFLTHPRAAGARVTVPKPFKLASEARSRARAVS